MPCSWASQSGHRSGRERRSSPGGAGRRADTGFVDERRPAWLPVVVDSRILSTLPIDDTVLDQPCAVQIDEGDPDLVAALHHVVCRHRLRAPVSGAYLGNGAVYSWAEDDGSGFFRLDEEGQVHLLEPHIEVPVVTDDPVDATRRWCEQHHDYTAVEGYLIERHGVAATIATACWAWSPTSHILIDPVRGRRGVPAGAVYLGCPVFLNIVRAATDGDDVLDEAIADLRLPNRVVNYLSRHSRIATVRELLAVSRTDLIRLPGMGEVALREVDAALADHGLYLPWASTRPTPAGRAATEAERAQPLSSLGLSPKVAITLTAGGVTTVGDLLDRTLADLLRLPRFGSKGATEVRANLKGRGLALKVYERAQPRPSPPDLSSSITALFAAPRIGLGKVLPLRDAGILTLADLVARPAADLLAIKGVGAGTLRAIREFLRPFGIDMPDPREP